MIINRRVLLFRSNFSLASRARSACYWTEYIRSGCAARSMLISFLIILVFVLLSFLHVLSFRFRFRLCIIVFQFRFRFRFGHYQRYKEFRVCNPRLASPSLDFMPHYFIQSFMSLLHLLYDMNVPDFTGRNLPKKTFFQLYFRFR
jgi:hypothetical protein